MGESASSDLKRQVLESADTSPIHSATHTFKPESVKDDDSDEVKRILQYRELAKDGDNSTALRLLEDLANNPSYSTGYLTFRLHFNIGIILQNIGETKKAASSLRKAYSHQPEHPKAKTAQAFADALEGQHQIALEKTTALLEVEGDHRHLAACIMFHAAKQLETNIDFPEIDQSILEEAEVVAAHLEYMRVCKPNEYTRRIGEFYVSHPDNLEVASMWASSILEDMRRNQGFLLGQAMPEEFEVNVIKSAEILRRELEETLSFTPPNKLLIPSQTNNAAIALRLSGDVGRAAELVGSVLSSFPEFRQDLAQIQATLLLQQDRDAEALEFIRDFTSSPELQVMASELEAQAGRTIEALERIELLLNLEGIDEIRVRALATKARIGINKLDQNAADEALEELNAIVCASPELVLLRSAYDRAFVMHKNSIEFEQLPIERSENSIEEKRLLSSLTHSDNWDFFTQLQAADELLARGYFRECADLLRDKVSLNRESPALSTLCDACLRGQLGSLAKEVNDGLSGTVKSSVFGCKFGASVAYLNGEIAKAVPLTKRLFDQSPYSLSALDWYIQSLLRANDRSRVQRLIKTLDDSLMMGTVRECREYVNLLVFCGEIERARRYAYRLFCENQSDHHAWMALSSSVLAVGRPPGVTDDFSIAGIDVDVTFSVTKPSGEIQEFTIEPEEDLRRLRESNIAPEHPIAIATLGMNEGDELQWPLKKGGIAKITSVKHKSHAAFHMAMARFEERFPNAEGFKSISVDVKNEGGRDEIIAMLKDKSEYSQIKAKEYEQGRYPVYILGHHLGRDPIDTVLGRKTECNILFKVSSCTHEAQEQAAKALISAKDAGIIADSFAIHVIRRLKIEDAVRSEFGAIGVTQHTLDIFSQRYQDAESSNFFEDDDKSRKTGSMAFRDGGIVLTEYVEEDVVRRLQMLESDLQWLRNECRLVPTVAKSDPNDAILRFRQEIGGRFFDDIFAADGSDRVLVSDDYHLRDWAAGLFGTKSTWLQALLFHLEERGKISVDEVVKGTIHLQQLGEDALSTNVDRLTVGADMFSRGSISDQDFCDFCSLLGQPGADMRSHVRVAASAIIEFWESGHYSSIRHKATSTILRQITRYQGENVRVVLDAISVLSKNQYIENYIKEWRTGHFLT
ncbi:MAG: hypothetical protein MK081_16000 [Flavobacteriales bacterium]|nr:hypothetical protein [Flavobacteriales bacterium]